MQGTPPDTGADSQGQEAEAEAGADAVSQGQEVEWTAASIQTQEDYAQYAEAMRRKRAEAKAAAIDEARRAQIRRILSTPADDPSHIREYLVSINDSYNIVLNDALMHLSKKFVKHYTMDSGVPDILTTTTQLCRFHMLTTELIDIIISHVLDEQVKSIHSQREAIGASAIAKPVTGIDVGQLQLPHSEEQAMSLSTALTSAILQKNSKEEVCSMIDSAMGSMEIELPRGYTPDRVKAFVNILFGYQNGFAVPDPKLAYTLIMKNIEAMPIRQETVEGLQESRGTLTQRESSTPLEEPHARSVIELVRQQPREIQCMIGGEVIEIRLRRRKAEYEKNILAFDYIVTLYEIFNAIRISEVTDKDRQQFESFVNMYTTYRSFVEESRQEAIERRKQIEDTERRALLEEQATARAKISTREALEQELATLTKSILRMKGKQTGPTIKKILIAKTDDLKSKYPEFIDRIEKTKNGLFIELVSK
jgi:hypothetical protein